MALRAGRRTGAAAAACALVLALLAAAAASLAAAGPAEARGAKVQTASTPFRGGDRVKTVPIARKPWQKARSIMSLKPGQIGRLKRGYRIEGSGEAEITICAKANPRHPGPGTPCVGRTYGYNPHLKMKLVLGPKAGSTGGRRTVAISRTRSLTCSQRQPNRNRHCIISIPWGGIKVPARASKLPCAPANCHLNMVLSASRSSARSREVVVVGSSDDNKRIHQGRGKLSSILFRGKKKSKRSWRRSKPYRRKLRVSPDGSDSDRQVAYSLPLKGLRKGDQIVVDAEAVTRIGSLPYNITQRAAVIFTNKPGSVKANGKILETNPRISADNGYGCTQGPSAHSDPCRTRKLGIASVRKGTKKTWYLNLVVTQEASDMGIKADRWRPSDRVKVTSKGGIRAWLYRGSSVCPDCQAAGGTFTFSPDKSPNGKLYKRLVRSLSRYAIESGRVSCQKRSRGPHKVVCNWHAEGRYGGSPRYVCDAKAFLGRKGNWSVNPCKAAIGAHLWSRLEARDISPTFAGACKDNGKTMKCKWYAKGEWKSGPYYCKGYGTYRPSKRTWQIDRCKNLRDN